MFKKLALSGILLLFINPNLFGNAAQPGVWNAGGTVFTMLYPEDSLTFKKVQMQQEKIYIQLYKGFAVVKGVYNFLNTTNNILNFKMGYPVNGIFTGGDINLNEVSLDSLNQFKVKVKNRWLPILEQPHSTENNTYNKIIAFSNNWKVWTMRFQPKETKKVEVYFIVNTNYAQVRKGYDVEKKNAFIYLLESGSVWRLPIEKGEFYIQLMDGLTPIDLHGISKGFNFKYNQAKNLYLGQKHQFSPGPQDNLVVNYYKKVHDFKFKDILAQTNSLYLSIDQLSALPKNSLAFNNIELGDPYSVNPTAAGYGPIFLIGIISYLPIIIMCIFITLLIWYLLKRKKIYK